MVNIVKFLWPIHRLNFNRIINFNFMKSCTRKKEVKARQQFNPFQGEATINCWSSNK